MNVLHEMIVKFRNLVKPNEKSRYHPEAVAAENDEQHVMSDDERLDESIEESMIASDPPGHISKSAEDRNLH